jgi:hypothetical protein
MLACLSTSDSSAYAMATTQVSTLLTQLNLWCAQLSLPSMSVCRCPPVHPDISRPLRHRCQEHMQLDSSNPCTLLAVLYINMCAASACWCLSSCGISQLCHTAVCCSSSCTAVLLHTSCQYLDHSALFGIHIAGCSNFDEPCIPTGISVLPQCEGSMYRPWCCCALV